MASAWDKVLIHCVQQLRTNNLDTPVYRERLSLEIKAINEVGEQEYFINLLNANIKYEYNENNLLICFLLGVVDDFDIEKPPVYEYGDFPDIDVDYIPQVQDYLKNVWAPKAFGADKVCSIGNYTTFGVKSALTDAARIFGKDRQEVLTITKTLPDKDEEGSALGFDTAIRIFKNLKAYCDANPDVADVTKRLVGRNRGMGIHAGGLLVSNKPIADYVPLVMSKDKKQVSAFVEGAHGTDLGPMGFVKFDLLAVADLQRVSLACQLIKERYGIKHICGDPDWSDTSYLNDPLVLAKANKGETKCIFQFDSEGMRELLRRGGVTSFDDLVAYNALYRPSCIEMGMHDAYVNRKNGKEEYEIIDYLQSILNKTYGVLVYQEQVMQILHKVGSIPLIHTEKVRKAISKKQEKIFKSYKETFVLNGMKNLDWTQDKVEHLWKQIEAFAGYGFNKSHSCTYSYVAARLLWLKCYYPLEFFTASLICEEKGEGLKEIKTEAKKYNIEIKQVDINKSDWSFKINEHAIYAGFSNIKGIGEDVAKKIVEGQPYCSFKDFLDRFGCDAKVLKPLIALGCFDNIDFNTKADRKVLHEYYEYYKDSIKNNIKKRQDIDKKFLKAIEPLMKTPVTSERIEQVWLACEDESAFQRLPEINELAEAEAEILKNVFQKYKKSTINHQKKIRVVVPLEEFVPTGHIDEQFKNLYDDLPQVAEYLYYGFAWDHLLEHSPDFTGERNFDTFETDTESVVKCIEALIVKPPQEKISKKQTKYYVLILEDANGKQNFVTVWGEDFERFKEEFSFWDTQLGCGNMVRIRLRRPEGSFKSYTFESYPKFLFKNGKRLKGQAAPSDKEDDARLIVMARPKKEKLCQKQ